MSKLINIYTVRIFMVLVVMSVIWFAIKLQAEGNVTGSFGLAMLLPLLLPVTFLTFIFDEL